MSEQERSGQEDSEQEPAVDVEVAEKDADGVSGGVMTPGSGAILGRAKASRI